MTKMIKMSLIAAVAVTGMTSVASAQNLEDAIKGVDVSGQLRYRYDDAKNNLTKVSTQTNEYTMQLNVSSKVNDMVTANVKVEALGVNATNNGGAHATTDQSGDRDVTLSVTKANFAANLGVATIIAGKQSVPSPFVDNSVDDTTRGTGAVALIPAGPVTIAAGYFNNYQRTD
ncbi:MAG: major outer membrane protein, partial [Epsilonproteobacteria bacterium]|nr:major outer membrane protein [Campylobacterota bacterium]